MARKPKTTKPALAGSKGGARSGARRVADAGIEGIFPNAMVADAWLRDIGIGRREGDLILECHEAIVAHCQEVRAGDLGFAETMLVSQAAALNAMFNGMAIRAGKAADRPETFERYMRLAFKAQAQARNTLETLAEVRFPRQVAFVRQANIANGPQQVNNGPAQASEQADNAHNKLLENADGQWLDAGATRPAIESNPPMEAVGEGNRAEIRQGKGDREQECVEGRRAPLATDDRKGPA